MANSALIREELYPSISFSQVQDKKFRHNCISINIMAPLAVDTAAATAILPFLLRRGSRGWPDYTLLEQQLCELYGASLGSDVLRYGQHQIISCSISFVDDRYTIDGEVISDRCADLLGDMVLHPKIADGAFDATDFALEQQNLIDQIEAEINDKRAFAVNQCSALLFAGTQLATPRYGTTEGARALTPAAAAARYAQLMETAQIEILFVGCGDPTPAKEKFRVLFANHPRNPLACPAPVLRTVAGPLRERTRVMEVAQGKLVLGFLTGEPQDEAARRATKLMTTLYGGTPNSRLFLHVREEKSLCYYCAARFDRSTSCLLVDIGVESKNKAAAQEAILEQLTALAKGDWSEQELHETKLAYANAARSSKDSLGGLESWYLVQILEGQALSPDDEVTAMDAVSYAEICAAAAKVTLDCVYFLTGSQEEIADAK